MLENQTSQKTRTWTRYIETSSKYTENQNQEKLTARENWYKNQENKEKNPTTENQNQNIGKNGKKRKKPARNIAEKKKN